MQSETKAKIVAAIESQITVVAENHDENKYVCFAYGLGLTEMARLAGAIDFEARCQYDMKLREALHK